MPGPYTPETTGVELVADYASTIHGKTILTTGVSPNGIGAHFVQTIAAGKPALLVLAGRSLDKIQQTADAIAETHPDVKTKALQLDLGSFATACKAAEELLSWDDVPVIDALVNNAGIMAVPYKLSPDGHESQFASNHLGHFLFTNLIMDKILAAPAPRIVSVSSSGHSWSGIRFPDIGFDASLSRRAPLVSVSKLTVPRVLQNGATYDKWVAYGQSKTANVLFALSLAEKLGKRGLLAFSVHPGTIVTQLASHLDFAPGGDIDLLKQHAKRLGLAYGWETSRSFLTQDQGVATHVYASFEQSIKDNNGSYLLSSRVADPYTDVLSPHATSAVEAEKLWKLSEKLVGQEFKY